LRTPLFSQFSWDDVVSTTPNGSATTVSAALKKLISADGWTGAQSWAKKADKIAPTLVGGSKKHGGPDLGPTRAKKAWAEMGVDGHGLANNPPSRDFRGNPKLTVQMAAVLQGFPPDWKFAGGKTAAYRQVGNAFPPPVAAAVAEAIYNILASDG
jgi:DNA (cytosine-5)-methyltransferase 1